MPTDTLLYLAVEYLLANQRISQAFNLVAQRDSKINLTVAEDSNHVATLAARDSETMKTITVLTLLFLPSTLVTVIILLPFPPSSMISYGIISVLAQVWLPSLTCNSRSGLQIYSNSARLRIGRYTLV